MVHGRLFVGTIEKGENQLVYTVPAEAVSLEIELSVTNLSDEVANIKIALSTGETPQPEEFVVTKALISQRNGTFIKSGMFVSAGEKVFITSNFGPLGVRISGTEK